MDEKLTLENYIDNLYEQVLNQIQSKDKTLIICGLAQFELLYQLCRTFDIETKYSKTRIYKKAFDTYPMIRHIFETKVNQEYIAELQNQNEVTC